MKELLRAVTESPDDDAPRLVYADSLMRTGDPRGEFIALQCAGTAEAMTRANELLEAHRAAWIDAMPNVLDAVFVRGFASAVLLRCGAPALACCDVEPIRSVTLDLGDADPLAAATWFAADARTSRIRALDLTRVEWGEAAFARLLGADLRSLRELHVGDFDCLPHAARAVAALEGLTTLGFHGDAYADLDEGIGLLASSPSMSSLETLTLNDCGLTPRAAIALGASPHLSRLRYLSFSGGSYQANRIRDDGALALARSATLGSLSQLALVHNDVSDVFLEALAAPGSLPSLTNLAVNSCARVTSAGIAALASSARFATMEQLWLGGCRIDDAGVIALATSPHNRALRRINLHGNPITAAGARALADSPLAGQLDLLSIELTPELEATLRPRFGDRLNPPANVRRDPLAYRPIGR